MDAQLTKRVHYFGLITATVVLWACIPHSLMGSHPVVFASVNTFLAFLVAPFFMHLAALMLLSLSFDANSLLSKIVLTTARLMAQTASTIDRILLIVPDNPFAREFSHHRMMVAMIIYQSQDFKGARKEMENILKDLRESGMEDEQKDVYLTLQGLLIELLVRQGEYETADRMAQALIDKLERNPELSCMGTALLNLGVTYMKQGKSRKAIEYCQKAMSKFKCENFEERTQNRLVSMAMNNLAIAHGYAGEYDKYRDIIKASMELKIKVLGTKKHRMIATSLSNLAHAHVLLEDYPEALKAANEANEIATELGFTSDSMYGDIMENLGDAQRGMGDLPAAKTCLDKAWAIQTKTVAAKDPKWGAINSGYGRYYCAVGDLKKAEDYFVTALRLSEKSVGESHPKTAEICRHFAELKRKQGETQEAERLEQRYAEIMEANKAGAAQH